MTTNKTTEETTTANMNCVKNQTKTDLFYGLAEQ